MPGGLQGDGVEPTPLSKQENLLHLDPNLGYYEDGGIPVFTPTMEIFADFPKFISKIENFGMEKGIVKVIPPKEWVDNLPTLNEDKLRSIKIKNPIMQHVNGTFGLYKIQNVEKQRTYSLPEWRWICDEPEHQPPAKRGERRRINTDSMALAKKHRQKNRKKTDDVRPPKSFDEFKNFNYQMDSSEFTPERCEELEKIYWKSLTYSTPMYGADMSGSLFDDSTTTWNVAHLDNILNKLKVQIPGVNSAYLYCGMWKATFAWHLEDMDLFSINYIHFGAPKQWYSISQQDHEKFYNLMRDMWPQEHAHCREFLRHKTFHASSTLLSQHGIKVNKIVHNQHEFMITFPYGYHSGFNYGYNVAESVNFATESWIAYGKQSKKCECISDSVGINVDQLERHLNNEFTESEEETEDDLMVAGLPTPPYIPSDPNDDTKVTKQKRQRRKRNSEVNIGPFESPKRHRRMGGVETSSITCVLCPFSIDPPHDDFIKSPNNEYVHRSCANYIPETDIIHSSDDSKELLVGLSDIPNARRSLKCLGCGSTKGACFQCSFPSCSRSYHGTCADSSGVLVITNDENESDNQFEFLCKHHRPKRIPISNLENDIATMNWSYSLLPGDVAQCQIGNTDIFAGIVEDNLLSESMVMIRPLPDCKELIEVDWRWIRHPFGGEEALKMGIEKKKKSDKLKQKKLVTKFEDLAQAGMKSTELLVQPPVQGQSTNQSSLSPGQYTYAFKLPNYLQQPPQQIVQYPPQQTTTPRKNVMSIDFISNIRSSPLSSTPIASFHTSPPKVISFSPFHTRKRSILHNNLSNAIFYRRLSPSQVQIGEEILKFTPSSKGDLEIFLDDEVYELNKWTPYGYETLQKKQVWVNENLSNFDFLPTPPIYNLQPYYYDFSRSRLSFDNYVQGLPPPMEHISANEL